jgi:DNA-binding IclR family transcriptional regulator
MDTMDKEKSRLPAPKEATADVTAEVTALDGAMPAGVQSIERAFAVLQLLARLGSAGVAQVAQEMGVHKSTASRVLSALEALEMVYQNRERGNYQLGFGILRLAHAIPARLDLVSEAREEMRRLAEKHRETVTLAVLRDGLAVNLAQEMGPTTIAAHNWIGSLNPLHATSSGKVLLAALPSTERTKLIAEQGLPALTARTITSRRKLERQLLDVAAQGYATVLEEFEIGLNGAAAPVLDHMGTIIASVSISGPAFRFTEEVMHGTLDDLQATGLAISRRMGHAPDADPYPALPKRTAGAASGKNQHR